MILVTAQALATHGWVVQPPGLAIGVDLGERWLPRGSAVLMGEGACPEGEAAVEVLAVGAWYRVAEVTLAAEGDAGCLDESLLRPAPPPGPDRVAAVRAEFEARFGAMPEDFRAGATDWGRVSPPLRYFDEAEIAAQRAAEGLVTEEQREKAVVASGPLREGAPVYLHFLGSDAPTSDVWGDPDMVAGLLALADGWFTRCAGALAPAAHCALQFGDLSWYNATRPDPLGHSPGHLGRCVDIRLFRDDGSRYEAWWNRPDDREGVSGGYSRALNRAFLDYAMSSQPITTAYFNDPAVYEAIEGVEPMGGHDDHMHLCW